MSEQRRLDIDIADVNELYGGPGGALWELLMGEQIHVGGAAETDILAQKAGIGPDSHVLDVGSALGGPARYLAAHYGCRVTGLDATQHLVSEAVRRTELAGLADRVQYRLGNALDMPFHANTFDVVWGQDAWCYITDKGRLMHECARVVKPGGVVAFTDWLETGPLSDAQWTALNTFMVFPYIETIAGYVALAEAAGLVVAEKEDLTPHFAAHVQAYLDMVEHEYRQQIIAGYGQDMYNQVLSGLTLWRDAAASGHVGRARFIVRKPAV